MVNLQYTDVQNKFYEGEACAEGIAAHLPEDYHK